MVWQETPRQSSRTTWPIAASRPRSHSPSRNPFRSPRSLIDLSSKKPTLETRGTLGGFVPIPSEDSQLSSSDKRKCLYLGTDTDSGKFWNRRSTGNQLTEATRWTMDFEALHTVAPLTPPETPVDGHVAELEWKNTVSANASSMKLDDVSDSGWETDRSQPVELPADSRPAPTSTPRQSSDNIGSFTQYHELDSYQIAPRVVYNSKPKPAMPQQPPSTPVEDTFEPTLPIRKPQPLVSAYCAIQPLNPAQESVHRRGLHKVKAIHSLRRHRNPSIVAESNAIYAVPSKHYGPKRPHSRFGSHSRASRSRNGSADLTALAMMAKNVPTITVTDPTMEYEYSELESRAKSWPQAKADEVDDEEEEARWQEITEPDDLKLCLAVLNKEIERRRRELRG